MDSPESNTCTFVVSIWVDASDINDQGDEVAWRGEIRNIMGEQPERTAFFSLNDLPRLIRPFLEARGIDFGPHE